MSQANERPNSFDVSKGIAALAYLANETSESMYSLLKMMYLADKLHLERFGRFIAGDTYCAMKQGPVPSSAYGIFQHLSGKTRRSQFDPAVRYFDYQPENDHAVRLIEQPDLDELSNSEINCLAAIVETYRKIGKWAVRDMSHDDAWKAAWNSRFFRKAIAMDAADIAQQFESPDALLAHLRDPHPGKAEMPSASSSEVSPGNRAA